MNRGLWLGASLAGLAMAVGCDDEPVVPPPAPAATEACAPAVLWKRTSAVIADVGTALEIDVDEVCTELGELSCADVFRVSLGEAEPFERALYERPAVTGATTPLALERVVTAACIQRVERDRAGDATVFFRVDLEAPAPDPTSPAMVATIDDLTRRFLGRPAAPAEIEALTPLARAEDGSPRAASEMAVLACFAVGTSAEFLFY